MHRSPPTLWLALSVLVCSKSFGISAHAAGPVPSAPGVRGCISAHADGQELRHKKQLIAAREHFLTCAAESCPALIRKDCSEYLEQVDASVPTLVLVAVDDQQRDLTNVSVQLDGRAFVSRLDGSSIPVDPGNHELRFETPDGQIKKYEIVARENEKGRRVVAQFRSQAGDALDSGAAPDTARRGPPIVSYVLGGVGVAALGSFAYFGLRGRSTEDCAPNCSDDQVDRMRTQYLAADISLAVGIGSLGAATFLWLTDKPSEERAQRGVRFVAAPKQDGVTFGATGRF